MSIERLILLASTLLGGPLAISAQNSTTNIPPSVAIVSPTNNAHFEAPADIFIMANGIDRDGQIVEVSFFANQFYIGGITNPPPDMSPLPPWRITWQGVPTGIYSLQARATDDRGARSWSPDVRVEVRGTNQPPPPQTNQIVITIEAVDSVASEQDPRLDIPSDPALFLVRRHGPTNIALTVFYRVGGSASNGVDYERLSGEVKIPAGATTAEIFVEAIDDLLVEGTETVIVNVIPPICPAIFPPPPECYAVGQPDTAFAYIRDNDAPPSNSPPTVRITAPPNGSMFREGSDIKIEAVTVDRDGYAPMVEFFANDRKIGEQIIDFIQAPPDGTPIQFSFTWPNVAAGSYTLTAKATDEEGATALSAPIGIRVGTNQPPPQTNQIVITIEAVDSVASEQDPRLDIPSDPALFLVRRHGPTNIALTVFYRVGGSASNGVDFEKLSGEVRIPAGATMAEIFVEAIDDLLAEGTESVVVNVVPPSCPAIYPPPPECYAVGRPDTAVAYIRDNDALPSNSPPVVRITAPPNGSMFREGSDIKIEAVTVDRDGYAPMVEFFANGRKIGEQIISFIQAPPDATPIQFSFTWSNVVAGSYALTARATDDQGATALSAPVGIRVGTNQPPPPPTNVVVSIVASDSYASEGPWTNWSTLPTTTRGTNTAEFVVRRAGPTNDPVTVRYHIGGTASNGVDYATLSGEVTIPAGVRGARILVVPLEDTLVEGIESVVLELAPSLSDAYIIGLPGRAAAVIADNDSSRPPCMRLPGGLFHICFPGTNGSPYRLEASSDLINWTELGTGTVTDGAIHFVDPDVDALPYRFYRAAPGN